MMAGSRGSASLARMVRQSCPTCSCRLLRWFTGTEFREYLDAAQVLELEAFFDAAGLRGMDVQAECWRCTRCDDFGVFTDA